MNLYLNKTKYETDEGLFSYSDDLYNINCRYCVNFSYKEPDFSTWDSDWDYKGGFEFFEVDMYATSVLTHCQGPFSLVYFVNLPKIVKDKFTEELRNHALRTVKEKYRIP